MVEFHENGDFGPQITYFHEIGDFDDRARLWHSCRVVQSAEKIFFHKTCFSFLTNKNIPRIISGIARGVGALWDDSKPSIFMIFDAARVQKKHLVSAHQKKRQNYIVLFFFDRGKSGDISKIREIFKQTVCRGLGKHIS